jgi:RNA-binding protein
MNINLSKKKLLRGQGHKLKPIITISDKGLSDALINEFEKTIDHHELIKIRIRNSDRKSRIKTLEELCQMTQSYLISSIGNTALIFRKNSKPTEKTE